MSNDKITWEKRAIETIAREMMRGLNAEKFKKATSQEIQAFTERNRSLIEEVFPYVPRGFSTVGAVICKCAIEFDKDRAIEFLANFKESLFQGRDDPVFLYRRWFDSKKRIKQNRQLTYQMTLAACRAFCQRRPIKEIRARGATKDVFEWDANWDHPNSKKNSSPSEEINL